MSDEMIPTWPCRKGQHQSCLALSESVCSCECHPRWQERAIAAEARAEQAERENKRLRIPDNDKGSIRTLIAENTSLRERLATVERERDEARKDWDDAMGYWKASVEHYAPEVKRLTAELASVRAALTLAERNSRSHFVADGEGVSICRICDQPDDQTRTTIDHAPDCPFAALAATPAAGEG